MLLSHILLYEIHSYEVRQDDYPKYKLTWWITSRVLLLIIEFPRLLARRPWSKSLSAWAKGSIHSLQRPLTADKSKAFERHGYSEWTKSSGMKCIYPPLLKLASFLFFFFFWLQLAGKQTRSAVQTQACLKKKYRGQFEKGEQNVVSTQNKLMQRLGLLISSDYGWTFKWGADSSS